MGTKEPAMIAFLLLSLLVNIGSVYFGGISGNETRVVEATMIVIIAYLCACLCSKAGAGVLKLVTYILILNLLMISCSNLKEVPFLDLIAGMVSLPVFFIGLVLKTILAVKLLQIVRQTN